VECSYDAALKNRPETLDCVPVDCANDVLVDDVIERFDAGIGVSAVYNWDKHRYREG
jgi:hypothetical protein